MKIRFALALCAVVLMCALPSSAHAQAPVGVEYRVLATSKTSSMQKEMQEAAEAGFRFGDVMGGNTAFGGSEVVVIMHGTDRPVDSTTA
jgi:ABC-type sugar transport system substrate-binding protein